MAKSKKEKKAARREREEQLKSISQRIQDKLLLAEAAAATGEGVEERVTYVLAPAPALAVETAQEDEEEKEEGKEKAELEGHAAAAQSGSGASGEPLSAAAVLAAEGKQDEEGDRVVLPSLNESATTRSRSSSALAGRKHHKMAWEELKVRAAEKFGSAATEVVDEHDGNAVDPLFTVRLKVEPHTVPVPHHWKLQRTFLSRQADREEAAGIVPAEVAALGIEKIRATKDKKANPNQIAFISCFMTGTPLQRKTYQVDLTKVGECFYEGKWRAPSQHTPGVLSKRLRQALNIGPSAPPPWLYSLQAMRRLPPAYPDIRIPGLNAPIPAGGQWGQGEGQWGEPPRGENNAFLFPGVRDEATAADAAQVDVWWGTVPPLAVSAEQKAAAAAAGGGGSGGSMGAPSPAPVASPRPASPSASRVHITPVPFQPQAYVPQQPMPAAHVTPQEYVHVQDNTANSTVAVGHVMMPKDSVPQQQQQGGGAGAFYPPGNTRPPPPSSQNARR